ncbi:MAG: YggS family pyridoxal phosphate-dependent enzyme [Acidobacteria bacterium]|nr:YggS family pyridoxal phosphate-dependent enzyme [Acidobacteriota bacterium]
MGSLSLQETIAANLADVRNRLARATARAGRPLTSIRLVAISKTHPVDCVRAAFAAGQTVFGENRVQEALEKISVTSDIPIEWHLVGHLQSNKVRKAAGAFACVHSIDGADLLRRVDDAAAEADSTPELFVQVDLAGEPTKHGAEADALLSIFDTAGSCRAATVTGLMVLPPFTPDPEDARPYFRRLRELREELAGRGVPGAMLQELSMGMSHDFEVAIEEGATLVRVGTAIFGAR